MTTFGIAPHFQSILLRKAKAADELVLLFDESLNKQLQAKQLDVHVRLWEGDRVLSRFWTSEFLGHATGEVLHERLSESCAQLGKRGILQLSMDGPNVSWKTYDLLSAEIEAESRHTLLNIGSRDLHIVHNAFRRAFVQGAQWNLEDTSQSIYRLFKDSPARSEDFTSATGCTAFGKKFCSHRWVESSSVVQRA